MRPLAADVETARFGAYRGLEEMEAAFEALPGVRVFADGRTHEGRAIRRYELGPADAPRVSLVLAGLHAMEWIGVEAALAIARRAAPADRKLVFLPLANPDGYARTEAMLRRGTRRYYRANARGVDLNRNFPTHWRRRHLRSTVFPFLGRPGAAAGSEAETRVVLDTLAREHGRLERAVSLHSIGKKILLPFGGRWAPPRNVERLRALAHEVNTALGGDYDVRQASHWAAGTFGYGMELDHLHAEGVEALLVECTMGGSSWRRPWTFFHPFVWYNPRDPEPEAARIAAALAPFLSPDGPVAARTTQRQVEAAMGATA